MQLEGIHHITAICADAPANLDFYVRVLGLRLVKKTVNFDAPDVYHLYYGDERGSPGSILTFFEFPGAAPGRPGAGMVHRLRWRVGSPEALTFWSERLAAAGVGLEPGAEEGTLRFRDPEGLGLELAVSQSDDLPLRAQAEDIPTEHALLGFDGVRAYALAPGGSDPLLREVLGFERVEDATHRLAQGAHTAEYAYDPPPDARGLQGAGTVHHIAWACRDEEQEAWRQRVAEAGMHVTPILDRQYFTSIYFREPSGVLFELATLGPGFAADEDPDHLGEELKLPPQHEARRAELERTLRPLADPRAARVERP